MLTRTRPGAVAIEPIDPNLAREWEKLALRIGATPFGRPGWVLAWTRVFAGDVGVATYRPHGELAALVPVRRRWGSVSTAANWHTPFVEVVGDPEDAAALLGHVAAGTHHLVGDFSSGPSAELFRSALGALGWHVRERPRLESPFVDLTPGWDAYRESLPAKKWRELRRRRRRLEDLGEVNFERSDGTGDLEGLLEEGIAVEGSGWKDSRGTSLRRDRSAAGFYREVAAWARDEGMLRLNFLRLDGRAIAFDLSLCDGDTEWLLKTGYDPELGRLSPGSLLRSLALESAFGEGLQSYDFLGNADAWKLEWTETTRPVVRVDGYRPGLFGAIARSISRGARMARWLR